jgi:hypothetical protein
VLPGGKAVLFTIGTLGSRDSYDASNIEAVLLATGERRIVIKGAAMARYCGDHHLVYSKGPALFAVPFDPERLTTTGPPDQIVAASSAIPVLVLRTSIAQTMARWCSYRDRRSRTFAGWSG